MKKTKHFSFLLTPFNNVSEKVKVINIILNLSKYQDITTCKYLKKN